MGINLNSLDERTRRRVQAEMDALKKSDPRGVHVVSIPTPRPVRRSKYGAVKTTVDGITFDSNAEAEHYSKLKLMMLTGDVAWFCRQPRFSLPGGIEYRADFIVQYNTPYLAATVTPPRVEVQDVKGMATDAYKLKKRLMKSTYGIEIVEVRHD